MSLLCWTVQTSVHAVQASLPLQAWQKEDPDLDDCRHGPVLPLHRACSGHRRNRAQMGGMGLPCSIVDIWYATLLMPCRCLLPQALFIKNHDCCLQATSTTEAGEPWPQCEYVIASSSAGANREQSFCVAELKLALLLAGIQLRSIRWKLGLQDRHWQPSTRVRPDHSCPAYPLVEFLGDCRVIILIFLQTCGTLWWRGHR